MWTSKSLLFIQLCQSCSFYGIVSGRTNRRGKEIPDFLVRPKNSRSFKPTDEVTALFKIIESLPKNEKQSNFTFKSEQPLLVVFSLKDCILNKDNKGVNVRLNEKDTQIFAEITRKFKGRVLLLKAINNVMGGMRIVEPIENRLPGV